MSMYSQAVLNKKPEFSYLETDKTLGQTYSDGTLNPYNPQVFPYAEKFMNKILKRVSETYAAVTEKTDLLTLNKELYRQLSRDFRFDFSDHLGPMRQRDKRGAGTSAEENDYNMFHSCYKFVNQAARAKSFGERYNLSLMSGRVNSDNQTGAEICDPFVFGPALYLYSKPAAKIVAMTLPAFDSPQKTAVLQAHEKEIKKDMFAKKAEAAKALKAQWHELINKKFIPAGLSFKDLSEETVRELSALHKDMLTELSARVETHYQNDVVMLKKVTALFARQMQYQQQNNTPVSELSSVQLASLHAMQANDLLKNSSVVQVSIEAEKPIYEMMADILEDDNSLTAKIYDNPRTREVFEEEMKKIHTVKDGVGYGHVLDRLVAVNNDKMPAYSKVQGEEYDYAMDRKEMAKVLREGQAMPKVSFMLAVVLMETGAKIEGGSSQIVYAKRIKEALGRVFDEAEKMPEFDRADLSARRQVFEQFDYRTAQAQIWGVKKNGNVLNYKNLIDGSVVINDKLLDSVAATPSQDAFDAACVHRFYEFSAKQTMSTEERDFQKQRVKSKLLQFEDKSDYTRLLAPESEFYKRLYNLINNDRNVKQYQAATMRNFVSQKACGW